MLNCQMPLDGQSICLNGNPKLLISIPTKRMERQRTLPIDDFYKETCVNYH